MAKPHILIVEDDPDNTALVRLLLERRGYSVASAHNGEQGLKVLRARRPDLIVLDLDMPVMDGWGMLSRMQVERATAGIPIIVVTAHLLPDERESVSQAGGSGYVLKPFRAEDLLGEIERVLNAS